ncbi:MAG: DUF6441 family protein, partial [Gammaproteobacteria bacterium]
AIPTDAALGGRRGWGGGRKFTDLTPGEWERKNGAKLRLVYRSRGASLLVLDEARLSGKRKLGRQIAASRRGKGKGETIVMFVLVPSVAHANRLALRPIIERAGRALEEEFVSRAGRIT